MAISRWFHIECVFVFTFQFVILEEAGEKGRVPYKSLGKTVHIKATGLPADIDELRKPAQYGRKQLESILNASETLTFHVGK